MTTRRWLLFLLLLLLGVAFLLWWRHRRDLEHQRVVRRWLLCTECVEGELDEVVALRGDAVPLLAGALSGPPESGRQNIRSQAEQMYRRLDSAQTTLQLYQQTYEENYAATYQARAAIALGVIATPEAKAILADALERDSTYRADVRRVLGTSVEVVLEAHPDSIQDAPVDSLVRAQPTVVVKNADSVGLGNLRVVFRIDSGGGQISDSVMRTDSLGTARVQWRLGPGVGALNKLRATAAGHTVRFRALGRDPAPRIAFLVQPENVRRGEPFARPVTVAVVDGWGNVVQSYNLIARIAVPGTTIGASQALVAGRMELSGLVFSEVRNGLQLQVLVSGLPPAASDPFDVLP